MATETDGLRIERVPLASLHPDPANARTHDERSLEAIQGALARFGQQKPIVVDRAHVIRAGNGTYEAAKALGWESIDVVVSDLEGIEATAYSIADNRTTDLSAFEPEALGRLLEELRAEDALEGVGYGTDEIDALLAELAQSTKADLEDPGPGSKRQAKTDPPVARNLTHPRRVHRS